ncbi:MAG: HPr family phosphocarrier protein [Anaerotruncus sp.]|nr:HPr family phosphocarrier protein [Anaerotruncus sp.]
MISTTIKLDTINDVKNFVNTVAKYEFDVDLVSGRYAVDAKSIMGIFSLDLSRPIKMDVYSDSCEQFLSDIKKFIVPSEREK